MKKNQYITPNTTVTAIMGAQSVFTAGFNSGLGDTSEGKPGSDALAKGKTDEEEFLDEEEELQSQKNAWIDGLW